MATLVALIYGCDVPGCAWIYDRDAKAHARIVLQGVSEADRQVEIDLDPGSYDFRVTGVATDPFTTLLLQVIASETDLQVTQVGISFDFSVLGADPGDTASGELRGVSLTAGARADLTIPVQWSGSTVGGSPFPLRVSTEGRYVEDANGDPFLLHGEAAWSLIAQLNVEEANAYLADREARGVQVIMVNLIEHQFSDDPPNNAYGEAPFLTPGDFTTPNEAYFAHADTVLGLARDHGIAVMLFPAYAGFGGGSEGWWTEMSAQTEEQCRQYGEFVGQRYAARQNIIWVSGGDYTLPTGTAGETCALAILSGIQTEAPDALYTGHWSPESTSLAQPSFASSIDLDGVYTYDLMYPAVLDAWTGSDLPVFMMETTYEGEHDAATADLRAQSWWAMLSGAVGQISGNRPIWLFASGWESALNSPLSQDMAILRAAFGGWTWWRLAPDTDAAFLVSGAGTFGNDDWATAALADDGRLGVVYLPPGGSATRSISLDLSKLADTATASWLDPSSGVTTAAGTFEPSGTTAFTSPGPNAAGDADWVLVLEVN